MGELLYGVHSAWIAAVLFVSMVSAMEAGHRLGRRRQGGVTESAKAHIDAMQASILGILALLLGFTFSLSLQRFDSRSEAVVQEANAIGTAALRARLLAPPLAAEATTLLRRYLDLRIETSTRPMVGSGPAAAQAAAAARLQADLWQLGVRAAQADPNPVRTGLFVQALNDAFDAMSTREAALARHVPEVVLLLLYATFVIAAAIIGFAAGVAGHRPSRVSHVLVALMVVLVFIVLDLDRPRRGLIEVSQKSLTDLQPALAGEAPAGSSAPAAGSAPGR